jgi:hypothetical protein
MCNNTVLHQPSRASSSWEKGESEQKFWGFGRMRITRSLRCPEQKNLQKVLGVLLRFISCTLYQAFVWFENQTYAVVGIQLTSSACGGSVYTST